MGSGLGGRSDELEGYKQSACADEDEEDADEAHHGFCGKDFTKFSGKGGGDDSTEDQAGNEG